MNTPDSPQAEKQPTEEELQLLRARAMQIEAEIAADNEFAYVTQDIRNSMQCMHFTSSMFLTYHELIGAIFAHFGITELELNVPVAQLRQLGPDDLRNHRITWGPKEPGNLESPMIIAVRQIQPPSTTSGENLVQALSELQTGLATLRSDVEELRTPDSPVIN